MALTTDEIERKVAADIMEYLAVAESEDHSLRTKRSAPVLQGLGWLLEDHLEGQEGFPFGIGIDLVASRLVWDQNVSFRAQFYGYAMWSTEGRR